MSNRVCSSDAASGVANEARVIMLFFLQQQDPFSEAKARVDPKYLWTTTDLRYRDVYCFALHSFVSSATFLQESDGYSLGSCSFSEDHVAPEYSWTAMTDLVRYQDVHHDCSVLDSSAHLATFH